jgi:carbonic anhydrase
VSRRRWARRGLIDNWLRTLKDTQEYYWQQLAPLDEAGRLRRLVERNVIEQVYDLGKTSIVQKSWAVSGKPYIHGWVFDVNTGYIRPQTGMINSDAAIRQICKFSNRIVRHDLAEMRAFAPA